MKNVDEHTVRLQLKCNTGPRGERGEKGEKGDKGDPGEPGAAGADGYIPQRGVDYWTEADRTQMVTDVLAALPTWEGGAY